MPWISSKPIRPTSRSTTAVGIRARTGRTPHSARGRVQAELELAVGLRGRRRVGSLQAQLEPAVGGVGDALLRGEGALVEAQLELAAALLGAVGRGRRGGAAGIQAQVEVVT